MLWYFGLGVGAKLVDGARVINVVNEANQMGYIDGTGQVLDDSGNVLDCNPEFRNDPWWDDCG